MTIIREVWSEGIRIRTPAVVGPLNLHFGRILFHRRLIKSDKRFISRAELVDRWISLVEQYMMDLRGTQLVPLPLKH